MKLADICIGSLLAIAMNAHAQVSLKVSQGWGGKERSGRWNPIFVKASSPAPRNATVELILPHEGGFATVIREQIALGPTAGTFELDAPSRYSSRPGFVVVVRDANGGKLIGQYPAAPRNANPQPPSVGAGGVFIGVSGLAAPLDQILRYAGAESGYLPDRLVPRAAIGFDSLEILFLNQPELAHALDREQQAAIVSWVKAGGSLLLTPGLDPLPSDSPLLSALPCRIGDPVSIDLPDGALQHAGLEKRFAHLMGRALTASPEARMVELIAGTDVRGAIGRCGLGRILIAPIDIAALEFAATQEKQAVQAFWQPIIQELTDVPASSGRQDYSAPSYGYASETEDQQREGSAIATLCDLTGAGAKGAGWLAALGPAVLGILLVVGPIDWLALKALHQQPWRVSTSIGLIAFVAVAAVEFRSFFDVGPASLGNVRVIDQVDNLTVGECGLMGITSGRAGAAPISPVPPADQWWEPIISSVPGNATSVAADAMFHQSDQANVPLPLWVSAGQARHLRWESNVASPPMLHVLLAMTDSGPDEQRRIVGTIRNISQQPLSDLHIRTAWGVVTPSLLPSGLLAPGQLISIDLAAKGEQFAAESLAGRHQVYGAFGSRSYAGPIKAGELWRIAGDLDARRSMRIDALLSGPDFACVYARSAQSGADFEWIRAVVRLKP